MIADFDFETYSPAGYQYNDARQKWESIRKNGGLEAVGAAVYTEHPDAEVLCMAYNLKNGEGPKLWKPGDLPPIDLFRYLQSGGLLEAWNASFECWVWSNICVPKYKWPPLPYDQIRCAMAKARAFCLPGGLDAAAVVLNLENRKDKTGKYLINKFSRPRNPTKNDKRLRIRPTIEGNSEDIEDTKKLYAYNLQDIAVENEASQKIPDLVDTELKSWQLDQIINRRGVCIDLESVEHCINVIERIYEAYDIELNHLTEGVVTKPSQVQKMLKWINQRIKKHVTSLTEQSIEELLAASDDPTLKRVLEIRKDAGSAAVKKLYAMRYQTAKNGRLHDLFAFHKARTGRAAGNGVQPQNLPKDAVEVVKCGVCGGYGGLEKSPNSCAWCTNSGIRPAEWGEEAINAALNTISTRDISFVTRIWGSPIRLISGCLRGLFIAAPQKKLIGSDYSAIEAVVLAMLSGEPWRVEVFRSHGKIYEASAAKITGVPLEEILQYKKNNINHHPARRLGKVAELASGYQGSVGAWKLAGAAQYYASDDEIKNAVNAWRRANPRIVDLWYAIERCATAAVSSPDVDYSYAGITFRSSQGVLYCMLPSGRAITYHCPKLEQGKFGNLQVTYETWNTNATQGQIGWTRVHTYGGRLVENIVQAVSYDILAHAISALEERGYSIVLHVHDELVAEVPQDFGSVEEFEQIMSQMPSWAADWPIHARGGWSGYRYRK